MKTEAICGHAAVAALFARRPDAVQRLFYTEAERIAAGPWCAQLAAARKPYRMLPEADLAKAAGTPHHGGLVAIAQARVPDIIDFLAPPQPRRAQDVLLLLDGIGNPHNLGAIARSAAFFGALGLVLHETPGATMPSGAAYRTAEGGLEHLGLWRTRDLPRAIESMKSQWRVIAALPDAEADPLPRIPRDRPLAIVLGHEETGIGADVLRVCRRGVRIIGGGAVQSLNVAQAASVLLYELR